VGLATALQDADYSVSVMARNLRVSRRTVQRVIKARTGMPARRYIKQLRAERALRLFQQGKTIKEIFGLLGYKNASQLSKDFKDVFGERPTKYAGCAPETDAQVRPVASGKKVSRTARICRV
jgi:AraC-like DNA-binding protein